MALVLKAAQVHKSRFLRVRGFIVKEVPRVPRSPGYPLRRTGYMVHYPPLSTKALKIDVPLRGNHMKGTGGGVCILSKLLRTVVPHVDCIYLLYVELLKCLLQEKALDSVFQF